MPEITFSCPRCGRNYQVRSLLAGKKVRCKDCKEISRISDPQAPAPSHLEPSVVLIACPQCGHDFRVSSGLAGKRARCKRCGEVFHIPSETKQQRPLARPNVEEAIGNEPEYALLEKSPALPVASPELVLPRESIAAATIPPGRRQPTFPPTAPGRRERRQPTAANRHRADRKAAVRCLYGLLLLSWSSYSRAVRSYGLFSRPWTAATDLFGISSG